MGIRMELLYNKPTSSNWSERWNAGIDLIIVGVTTACSSPVKIHPHPYRN